MKIGKFGKKISKDFNRTFAKKNLNKALEIGKKIGHQIDVGERKLVNTIHDVAPSLAIASDFYMPGSGEAILKADAGIGRLHSSGRNVVNKIPNIVNKGRKLSNEDRIRFGGDLEDVREKAKQSDKLLRDAGNQYKTA